MKSRSLLRGAMFGSTLLLTAVVGCEASAPTDDDLLALRLETGLSVRELLARRSPSAVILVDPLTCLSCEPVLTQWLLAYQRGTQGLSLVLCRPPTRHERDRLAKSRVQGWLLTRKAACASQTGTGIILIADGEGVMRAVPSSASEKELMRVVRAEAVGEADNQQSSLNQEHTE